MSLLLIGMTAIAILAVVLIAVFLWLCKEVSTDLEDENYD